MLVKIEKKKSYMLNACYYNLLIVKMLKSYSCSYSYSC